MSFTFKDFFCGAGGSISGLVAAGGELVLGANHWDRAIETVSANHPDADFLCADINNMDMRRLPRTQVLWASVLCTEASPAGGRRRTRGQMELEEYGHVPAAAFERTRACALDVVRATEVHRYDIVVVENVVEFARDWELYGWWVDGMCRLGYQVHVTCVSAAHIGGEGNPHAPQWRDRIFVTFVRDGIRMPDLEPRPVAWCFHCEEVVESRQSWKRPDRPRIGKYGQQYVYRCPRTKCRQAVVEPFVRPAAAAIDWSDLGQRIGDRAKPLADATMRRIRAGLDMFDQPTVVAAGGNTWEAPGGSYVRAWPALDAPLMTRSGTPGDGIATPAFYLKNYGNASEAKYRCHPITDPLGTVTTQDSHSLVSAPFLTMLRGQNRAMGVDEPMATLTTGRNHALTVPPGFLVKNYGGNAKPEDMAKPLDRPLGTITTKDHHSLVTWPHAMVVPYRRGRAKHITEPLHTLATRESGALVSIEVDPEDCNFRMLKPREHLNGQRFPGDYIVHGNQGEQTMQAGNAVPCNVAQWHGERFAEVLG